MQILAWALFAVAAVFEVGGDAVIRFGLKGNSPILILFGVATIGSYGLIVNSMDWDFSTIFGVYVALFAATAILFGKFIFRENIPATTWIGLVFIMAGGLIIQLGSEH
jgi:small multidrug resistance family-3 protein